ncbi:MAG TPA: hypothetical protein VNT20_14340 [Flavisolibacter sp.]|jgi:hypothetical protein|nr:hypothetical protein [Flavisolibacter sp.]
MKKSALFTQLITAAFFTSLVMIACKKENSSSLSPAEEEQVANYSSESETENEVVFNDVFDNVIGVNTEVGIGGTGVFGRLSSSDSRENGADTLACVKVSVTLLNAPARFPMKIVIDFGTGCVGRDGHTRSGKIIAEYSGKLTEPGNSATTRFDGFKFDSISVQGTHKITNTTASGSNQRQFTIDVTDAKLSKPNGNYSLWTGSRVITQIEGNGTPLYPLDDIFKVTGSSHGQIKHGDLVYTWRSEITEPLIKKFTCHWISKGIVKVRREALSSNSQWVASLDYGAGDCDFLAALTINGTSHQIQLPH